MDNFDETLQKARQAWLLNEIKMLDIKYPIVKISEVTGYSKGTVSNYLSGKGFMSLEFIKTFCEKFGYSFETINAGIIEKMATPIGVPNKTNNLKEKNSKKLSGNKDNLLASQLTINEDDMHTFNLELVRHIMKMNEELIAINGVLARKVPDLKDDEIERKPLKERRA